MLPFELVLRSVEPADQELLLRAYASTRAGEMALTGWDAATRDAFVRMQFQAQTHHYRRCWPASEHAVIEVHRAGAVHAAGRLWTDRRADAIHVLDIVVLPTWAGRGIGTQCLRRLIDEAAASGRAVSIHVEQGNPARRLYERLGFAPTGPQQGLHQPMAWRPAAHVPNTEREACDEQA
jgi:GNAT superfamily N-acetyltransferase